MAARDPRRLPAWVADAHRRPVPGGAQQHPAHAPRPAGVARGAVRARAHSHRVARRCAPSHRFAIRSGARPLQGAHGAGQRDVPRARARRARAREAAGRTLRGRVAGLFLEAGQDGVEHGFPLAFDSLSRDKRMAFWRELAKRDVGVVPTAVVLIESYSGRRRITKRSSLTRPARRIRFAHTSRSS